MELAAERGAGASTPRSGRTPTGETAAFPLPTAPEAAVPHVSRWTLPLVAYAISLVTVPLAATGAVALHATAWPDLVALGGIAAFLGISLVLLPLQFRLARMARTLAGIRWGEAERSAEREAELSAEREELLHDALAASDRERRELAADLHDGVIQLTSAATLRTATLARGLRRDGGRSLERVAATADGLDRITLDLQAVTADLRGLMGTLAGDEIESGGLTGALSSLLLPLAESGVQVDISVGELDCDARTRTLLHRVAQELIRNTAKHAEPQRVELTVAQDREGIRLRLTDDGRGFDLGTLAGRQRNGHMGLLLVRQRVADAGGVLEISSREGAGTTVEMRLPVAGPG